MTDASGAADAAAAPLGASDMPADMPAPIATDNTDYDALRAQRADVRDKGDAPDKPAKPARSARDALEDAADRLEDEGEAGSRASKAGADRAARDKAGDTTGRRTGEGTTDHSQAPTRFSADARAEWARAPESVRAESHRAIRELERGIADYQKKFEPLRRYEQMARQHNTSMEAAMQNYTAIDALLHQNPMAGLEKVCNSLGFTLNDVAARITGQKPDQRLQQAGTDLARANQTIQQLTRRVRQLEGGIRSHTQRSVSQEIARFRADPAHARYEELEPQIARFLGSGLAETLKEAYTMADRLNPGSGSAASSGSDRSAQTRKARKSVTGAPSAGSDPAARQPSSSIKDSLKRAVARTG